MAVFPFAKTQQGVLKPAILVRLGYIKSHKITSPIFSLIDSGADSSYCSYDIASYLGFTYDVKKEVESTAANNKQFESVPAQFNFYVAGRRYETTILVSKELPPFPQVILGMSGLFDHFRVCIDLNNKTIELT